MKSILAGAALTGCLFFAGCAAMADTAGELEYTHRCSACHGMTGQGDGSLADLMTVEVPDLTRISQRNDGEFPMLHIIEMIDGRSDIRAHGIPMPVWGDRFSIEIAPETSEYGAELIVRGRILALATYLQSIQQ